jgi:hypothetical protein
LPQLRNTNIFLHFLQKMLYLARPQGLIVYREIWDKGPKLQDRSATAREGVGK